MSPLVQEFSSTPRDMKTALWRGFRCLCPNCGKGQMFRAYLKVADRCEACGEELHHHRADDMPPYLTMLVVGHIVVPLILAVETDYAPPYWLHALIWLPLTLTLSLLLLPRLKGVVVALQWANRMHGFDSDGADGEARTLAAVPR